MLDSRKTNPECRFAEELVSYLYDEMDSKGKVEFEKHLNDCSNCPEELAAFASVSSSVQDWRDAEFTGIATPKIEYGDDEIRTQVESGNESESGSYIGLIRGFFDFSPAFLKTASALGAFAIVLGLGWFLVSGLSKDSKSIVEKQNQNPAPKQKDEEGKPSSQLATVSKPVSDIVNSEKTPPQEIVQEPKRRVNYRKPSTSRAKTAKRARRTNTNRIKPRRNTVKRQNTVEEVPRLTEELAIEDSDELRLTDIFSDVGSDK